MLYANTKNVIITNIYSTNENDNYYINMNAKVKNLYDIQNFNEGCVVRLLFNIFNHQRYLMHDSRKLIFQTKS